MVPRVAVRELGVLPVAAASGIVAAGPHLYIVGDDHIHLTVLGADDYRVVAEVRLFPDHPELPEEHEERKRLKPDLESIARLPGDRLLVIGSGSRPNRCRGAVVPLFDPGRAGGAARPIDLAPLYRALGARLSELNIEGAAISGDRLRLLQRGNGAAGQNAVIDLDLGAALRAIDAGIPLGEDLIVAVTEVALGAVAGVPLTFTDASPLPDGRLVFAAAAEDTCDPYLDGPCAGSAVGVLSPGAAVTRIEPLETAHKIEGVHARRVGDRIDLLLVADADDPSIKSPLLAASIAAG